MSRTELYGLLPLEEDIVEKLREQPFLGLWACDDDGNTSLRPRSLNELGLVQSHYDHEHRLWFFEFELHDDDWANADLDPLRKLLAGLPLVGGRGIIVARQDWKSVPSWMMLVQVRVTIEKTIIDRDEEDPDFVRIDEAARLVGNLEWTPAQTLFGLLRSRGCDLPARNWTT